jgi:hypothetical protein
VEHQVRLIAISHERETSPLDRSRTRSSNRLLVAGVVDKYSGFAVVSLRKRRLGEGSCHEV